MKINEIESRHIIKELNAIIDEYVGKDYELMDKVEDIVFQILVVVEQNLIEEMSPDFLHHLFVRSRVFKNKPKARKAFKQWLAEKRRNKC